MTPSSRARRASPDRWLSALLLVLAFGAGFLVSHSGWLRQFNAAVRDPRAAFDTWRARATIPSLTLDIDFADFQLLSVRRERAIETGANLASEFDAVPATMAVGGVAVDVLLRLPEAMAAELSGERWPFEFAARDGQTVFGIARGRLTPVDAGSGVESLYLMMLRSTGLPVAERHSVALTVNGAAWGQYIVTECPSNETLVGAGFSPESVIVFFDGYDFLAAQPVISESSFAYAQVVVGRSTGGTREEWGEAMGDSTLDAVRAHLVRSVRALEAGAVAPSVLFDVEGLAKFLAVTTFWYGSPDLDWRTLVLVYDPATLRLTPIGTTSPHESVTPLPASFTSDPVIRRAYVQTLEALSDPVFLAGLSDAWDADELRLIRGLLAENTTSVPDVLAERRQAVERMLTPSRTLFATATESDGTLLVRLDAVLLFPVEIVSLDFGERGRVPVDMAWIVPETVSALVDSSAGVVLRAREGDAPVTTDLRVPPGAVQAMPGELRLVTRIWGLDHEIAVPVTWGIE